MTEQTDRMVRPRETLVDRLRATPNWQRESFEHWKTATNVYDRAPFEAADEIERLQKALDALLAHCEDPECAKCGAAICPHSEPFHFHHDGCPACSQPGA